MRERILITAHHFDRLYSMESRLAWHRAQYAASEYDVTVICESAEPDARETLRAPEVIALPHTRGERWLMASPATHGAGYRRWQRRVHGLARRLHAERPFALVHHVSYCGYRQPGECWRLDAPFVWGPVGGTQPFPTKFLGQLDSVGVVRELVRNGVNAWQLRSDRRVRKASRTAACILAANREVAADLTRHLRRESRVQLETGVAAVRSTPRPLRNLKTPLRILWAGRLRSWKGLPLLLKALATLPSHCRYQLRVLGQGPRENAWRRLAASLGVDQFVEWVGWSEDYRQQLPHYDWADVFAFTSLRDTSGTGLLEALAAGAPIIGLNHQGAADIMTEDCSIRVPANDPCTAIAGFAAGVEKLAADAALLSRLSAGASGRAYDFTWQRQWEATRDIYQILAQAPDAAIGGTYDVGAEDNAMLPDSSSLEVAC